MTRILCCLAGLIVLAACAAGQDRPQVRITITPPAHTVVMP